MKELFKKFKKKMGPPVYEGDYDFRTEAKKDMLSMRCAAIIIFTDLITISVFIVVIISCILKRRG